MKPTLKYRHFKSDELLYIPCILTKKYMNADDKIFFKVIFKDFEDFTTEEIQSLDFDLMRKYVESKA